MSTTLSLSPAEIPAITERLYEAAHRYGRAGSLPPRGDFQHDLTLMARHDDLRETRFELLDARGGLVWTFWPDRRPSAWPVLAPGLVASARLLVSRSGRDRLYAHELRRSWNRCAAAAAGAVDDLDDDDGRFRVGAENRVTVIVTRSGPFYAFGRCPELGRDGVFLLPRFAPPGFQFAPGQRLTCALVTTSRGLQARAIRPATS